MSVPTGAGNYPAGVSDNDFDLPSAGDEVECRAGAGSDCSCPTCQAEHDYWAREWERYGRREVANRYSRGDVLDAYSHPTEQAKRDGLLRDLEASGGLNAG